MPSQPDFEIEASIPDANDRSLPNWSDLTLVVTQAGGDGIQDVDWRLDLTRPAGEAIIEALHGALHPWAGRSIIEHLWEALDEAMEPLLDGDGEPTDTQRGYARGLATALAVMYNPLAPNVDDVRETAIERWEMAQE